MEIKVSAELYYNHHDSYRLAVVYKEGLYASVKFRERGKLFRTEKRVPIVVYSLEFSSDDTYYSDYYEYLDRLNYISENKSIIYNKVEDIVIEHFKDKQKDENKDNKLEETLSKFNDISKFELKVKIK